MLYFNQKEKKVSNNKTQMKRKLKSELSRTLRNVKASHFTGRV